MSEIVCIKWRDSSSCNDWTGKQEVRDWASEEMIVESVGFLVEEEEYDGNFVTLASMKTHGMYACYHKIPCCSIIGKRFIKEGESERTWCKYNDHEVRELTKYGVCKDCTIEILEKDIEASQERTKKSESVNKATREKDREFTINGYSAGTLACHVMDRFADDPEKKDAIIKFMLQIPEGE